MSLAAGSGKAGVVVIIYPIRRKMQRAFNPPINAHRLETRSLSIIVIMNTMSLAAGSGKAGVVVMMFMMTMILNDRVSSLWALHSTPP
jgi:hypothetical protein